MLLAGTRKSRPDHVDGSENEGLFHVRHGIMELCYRKNRLSGFGAPKSQCDEQSVNASKQIAVARRWSIEHQPGQATIGVPSKRYEVTE